MTDTNETQTIPTKPDRTSFWHRKPTRWIAGGLGAAALMAGGIGFGAAIAGDEDDNDRRVATERLADTTSTDADGDAQAPEASSGAATYGAKDAGALSVVLAAARGEAKGVPTSMEAHRNGGWSVDFEASNGDETTVLVAADRSATVVRTETADTDDANDPAPAGKLNDKTLVDAVDAAFAKAQGVIIDIDVDDNPREAYSVQILAADGIETEIELSTDFEVTQVDVDED